jgi:hypothetical protein
MGNTLPALRNKRRSSSSLFTPPSVHVIYTLIPQNTTHEVDVNGKTSLDELQALLATRITVPDKYTFKLEFKRNSGWSPIESPHDWYIATTLNKFHRKTEPLQMRVSLKPMPLHLRRSPVSLNNVRVPTAVAPKNQVRARRVSVPENVRVVRPTHIESEPPKFSNDELFTLIMQRRDENRYLRSKSIAQH